MAGRCGSGRAARVAVFRRGGVARLMVSRIPYPHIVNQIFGGAADVWAPGRDWCLRLLAVMLIRGYAVPILCVLFVLVSAGQVFLAASAAASTGERADVLSAEFGVRSAECGRSLTLEPDRQCLPDWSKLLPKSMAVAAGAAGRRLVVAAPTIAGEAAVGESIAVNGCCLTVVRLRQGAAGVSGRARDACANEPGRTARRQCGESGALAASLAIGWAVIW